MGSKTKRDDGVARKITHPVRFASDEYEQLKEKAYSARVSISEFIRRAALRRRVVGGKVAKLSPTAMRTRKSY